jgi:hypothetical protein
MNIGVAASWGVLGGLCVEALWLYSRIRSDLLWSWRRPIPQGLTAYLISLVARVGVGAGVAAAAAGSSQVSGPLATFGLGVGAPLVVEKLAQTVPLTASANARSGKQKSEIKDGSSIIDTENINEKDINSNLLDSVEAEPTGVGDAS